jgi:protoporphyrinogen/coproporphyrinogen III oxidase
MKRVVIVGGGITGLAAAHALEKAGSPHEVRVLEAADHLGGNLVTVRHNGFIIDSGPDSWVRTKPHATRLAQELGLGDELIGTRPDTRKVYIVWQKRLYPMPEGLVLGVPTEWRPFAATELLGLDAKLRALLEPLVPKKQLEGTVDESIGAFVSRRLGSDIAERIAGPLLGGIFAGDPDSLSVRACVPQLVEAEAEHGSLVLAMRALREKRRAQAQAGEAESSMFLSLKRGMGDLVVNVAHRLKDAAVSTSTPAERVVRLPANDPRGRWVVETARGEALYADDVALTLPGHAASRLVRDVDAGLSGMLADMAYVSTATVFLAYRKFDVRHPLDAVGFLVPRAENRPILACTFVSSKWDHRAPSGQVLLRVFMGGAGNEHVLERDDDALVATAREQLLDLLGIDRAPAFSRVFRFRRASPQPQVGHLARMEALFRRIGEHPGLHVGGNGYVGTGIPDAIKQGEEIAARISEPCDPRRASRRS